MGGALGRSSHRHHRHHHHHHHRDNLLGSAINIHGKSYTFHRRVGAGAFGAVYSAQSPHRQHVAIKVVDLNRVPGAGPALADAYLNEVRHLQKLRRVTHHVVHIYDFDFDFDTGRAYIVMELGGDNLAKAIHRSRTMSHRSHGPGSFVDPILRQHAWRQMVTIVRTLTENDIVHMDLKPDNIILFGRTLKIADLGISKKAEMLAQPGVGTPYFSAPEIMQDDSGVEQYYGPKADVWSLGAILYYMTYGVPPRYTSYAAEPPHGQLPSRDHALVDMLHRTLALDPHARADIYSVSRHPFTNR